MSLYGDLDISVIDELPPGRNIQTVHRFGSNQKSLEILFDEILWTTNLYCISINSESEKMDFKDLMDG
jgi:ATP-dependent DNA helicase RecG